MYVCVVLLTMFILRIHIYIYDHLLTMKSSLDGIQKISHPPNDLFKGEMQAFLAEADPEVHVRKTRTSTLLILYLDSLVFKFRLIAFPHFLAPLSTARSPVWLPSKAK